MLQLQLSTNYRTGHIPELTEVDELVNDLRHLLMHSEQELIKGETRENVLQLEGWIKSYNRGLSAAQKISSDGADILYKTRDQLKLTLVELLRLEDEGGNPANKEQASEIEKISAAVRRIDQLIPIVEQSFQLPAEDKELALI